MNSGAGGLEPHIVLDAAEHVTERLTIELELGDVVLDVLGDLVDLHEEGELTLPQCIEELRIGLVGAAPTPVRMPEVEQLAVGRPVDDSLLAELRAAIAAAAHAEDDPFVSAAYRGRVAAVAASRALATAWLRIA